MNFVNKNIISRSNQYFSNHPDLELNLLESASAALVDLSFNEFNIHYLKTSCVEPGFPYLEFEEYVLGASWEFYNHHLNVRG